MSASGAEAVGDARSHEAGFDHGASFIACQPACWSDGMWEPSPRLSSRWSTS